MNDLLIYTDLNGIDEKGEMNRPSVFYVSANVQFGLIGMEYFQELMYIPVDTDSDRFPLSAKSVFGCWMTFVLMISYMFKGLGEWLMVTEAFL